MRNKTIYGYGYPKSILWYRQWRDCILRIIKKSNLDSDNFKKGITLLKSIDKEMVYCIKNIK